MLLTRVNPSSGPGPVPRLRYRQRQNRASLPLTPQLAANPLLQSLRHRPPATSVPQGSGCKQKYQKTRTERHSARQTREPSATCDCRLGGAGVTTGGPRATAEGKSFLRVRVLRRGQRAQAEATQEHQGREVKQAPHVCGGREGAQRSLPPRSSGYIGLFFFLIKGQGGHGFFFFF